MSGTYPRQARASLSKAPSGFPTGSCSHWNPRESASRVISFGEETARSASLSMNKALRFLRVRPLEDFAREVRIGRVRRNGSGNISLSRGSRVLQAGWRGAFSRRKGTRDETDDSYPLRSTCSCAWSLRSCSIGKWNGQLEDRLNGSVDGDKRHFALFEEQGAERRSEEPERHSQLDDRFGRGTHRNEWNDALDGEQEIGAAQKVR